MNDEPPDSPCHGPHKGRTKGPPRDPPAGTPLGILADDRQSGTTRSFAGDPSRVLSNRFFARRPGNAAGRPARNAAKRQTLFKKFANKAMLTSTREVLRWFEHLNLIVALYGSSERACCALAFALRWCACQGIMERRVATN